MAKTKKEKTKELSSLRQKLLKAYCTLKKKDPNNEIPQVDFHSKSEFGRYDVYKCFRTYTQFKDEAEEKFYKELPQSQRALLSERKKKFDPDVSKEDCVEDLRRVQKLEPAKHITRNYYRENGLYSDSTWNQYFGTFQEFRRQAGLELTRHQHKIEKAIAKHASNDHYKEYFDSEVMPYYRKYEKATRPGKIKTIMVISDVHDVEADTFTLGVFIDTCKRKQPDIIVLNGDIFDLYEFSRYTKDPRNYDIKGRFEFIWNELFAPLRKVCPDAQIDFVMGNHEFRLIKLLADATPNLRILLSDIMELSFADIFKCDDYQINWVSKANLSAFSKKDIDNELKQNFRVYYNCYVVAHEPDKNLMVMSGTNGHHHRLEIGSNAFIDNRSGLPKQVTWVQTPAAHVKDAEYLTNLSKWNTGFLEVTINIEKKQVLQKVHQTHDWTVIDGVYYERKVEEEDF